LNESLLNRIKHFIKFFKFEIYIISLIGIFTIIWLSLLSGIISNLFGSTISFIISYFGWFISLISLYYVLHIRSQSRLDVIRGRIEVLEECNAQLRRTKEILDWVLGFDEKLDKAVSIYSKLVKSTGTGTTNALVNFSLSTGLNDTVFLIRINHDSEIWHFQVAGRPIHLEQARVILLSAIAKIEAVAGPENIIQKKDLITN
jgi:hypothetical protein